MDANHPDQQKPDHFVDSHGFFAFILMAMFAAAIALSIVGFTTPSWLGFS